MRTSLLALLLAACASAPPRPLPAADWARAAKIYVAPTQGVPDDFHGYPAELKATVESDLRNAGVLVLPQMQNIGEVQLLIASTDWAHTDDALIVTLMRGSDQVDRFQFTLKDLPCMGVIEALPCMSREVAARTLESKAMAAVVTGKPAPATGQNRTGKLAVLELRNFTRELTKQNAQYFTDVVRGAALKSQPQLEVITRENLIVLLQSSGRDLSNCEGECEVDTGRRIGADLIVSGEIQKVGTKYKLTLRLHDTRQGRLLASSQASGATIDELDGDAQRAAAELMH
ncbi:MAG TPA: DUF2380 domain-containing protein [Myxococcales bacterium]|nr:DUF2380 domain-containing protein [Myxococcales bacterium]